MVYINYSINHMFRMYPITHPLKTRTLKGKIVGFSFLLTKIRLPTHTNNKRLKVLKLKIITLSPAKPFIYPTSLPQILYLHYLISYLTISTFSSHLPHSPVDHPLFVTAIVCHMASSPYSHRYTLHRLC